MSMVKAKDSEGVTMAAKAIRCLNFIEGPPEVLCGVPIVADGCAGAGHLLFIELRGVEPWGWNSRHQPRPEGLEPSGPKNHNLGFIWLVRFGYTYVVDLQRGSITAVDLLKQNQHHANHSNETDVET
jgi:hypothetical protein